MRKQNVFMMAIIVFLCLVFGGCGGTITGKAKVQQEAFGKTKKYAVVSICADREFSGEKSMFKKAENVPGMNSQPIIDKLAPSIRKKFARTKYFESMPKKTIVNSKAYKDIEEDERTYKILFSKRHIITANGYKYIKDPQKLAKLAKELNVDGVVNIYMAFSAYPIKSTAWIGPLTLGKKKYASTAAITVVAYDREGNVVWNDDTIKQAEPGDEKAIVIMDLAKTDFEKLHPSAVLIGDLAVDILLERFTDTMEGRGTSAVQKMRDKRTKEETSTKER